MAVTQAQLPPDVTTGAAGALTGETTVGPPTATVGAAGALATGATTGAGLAVAGTLVTGAALGTLATGAADGAAPGVAGALADGAALEVAAVLVDGAAFDVAGALPDDAADVLVACVPSDPDAALAGAFDVEAALLLVVSPPLAATGRTFLLLSRPRSFDTRSISPWLTAAVVATGATRRHRAELIAQAPRRVARDGLWRRH